jgi:hypothetical protein
MSDGKSPSWFYPKRSGDPGRDRNARTIQFACLLFAIAIGTAVALDVISREPIPIPIVSTALGGLCAAAVLNHAGRPTSGGRIVIQALLLFAALRVIHASDGFRSHAMLMFPGSPPFRDVTRPLLVRGNRGYRDVDCGRPGHCQKTWPARSHPASAHSHKLRVDFSC